MSDFGGTPFAAGVITGLRVWNLAPYYPDAPLQAVYHTSQFWRRGENKAICDTFSYSHRLAGPVAAAGCTCGFYAYYDQAGLEASHHGSGLYPVVGIIEGYGHVTVGTKGFRAAKARIVALTVPTNQVLLRRAQILRRAARLDFLAAALYTVGLAFGIATGGHWWLTLINAIGSGFFGYLGIWNRRRAAALRATASETADQLADVYGVPVYSTVDEMLAEHPTIPPPPEAANAAPSLPQARINLTVNTTSYVAQMQAYHDAVAKLQADLDKYRSTRFDIRKDDDR